MDSLGKAQNRVAVNNESNNESNNETNTPLNLTTASTIMANVAQNNSGNSNNNSESSTTRKRSFREIDSGLEDDDVYKYQRIENVQNQIISNTPLLIIPSQPQPQPRPRPQPQPRPNSTYENGYEDFYSHYCKFIQNVNPVNIEEGPLNLSQEVRLPPELGIEILNQLSLKDLSALSITCKNNDQWCRYFAAKFKKMTCVITECNDNRLTITNSTRFAKIKIRLFVPEAKGSSRTSEETYDLKKGEDKEIQLRVGMGWSNRTGNWEEDFLANFAPTSCQVESIQFSDEGGELVMTRSFQPMLSLKKGNKLEV